MLPKDSGVTDSNDQCVLEVGAVETKFFQFLLTGEERKDDSKKESKWKLPGEEEILRNPICQPTYRRTLILINTWGPVLPTTRL